MLFSLFVIGCSTLQRPFCSLGSFTQRRFCAGYMYTGKYVRADSSGTVIITQPRYPKYTGAQNLRLWPKAISEMRFDDALGGIPYQMIDPNDFEGPFDQTTTEIILNKDAELFSIVGHDQISTKPYSSYGRLKMVFPDKKGASGSGAALDKNLVITAAHNFLPPTYNGHSNVDRVRAEEILFQHMLTASAAIPAGINARVSTHCFIHPEWEKDFNPRYDVALVFLSESLKLTQEQIDELLKLNVINGVGETIRVVGHPNGTVQMSESRGKADWQAGLDSQDILYHFANTLAGSSGSPIISEYMHLVGTHTRGAGGTIKANSGVRMRLELLPFLDASIASHQKFLEHAETLEQKRIREEEEKQQALIDKGKVEGKKEGLEQGKKEMAQKMHMKDFSLQDISEITGLSEEDIQKLVH